MTDSGGGIIIDDAKTAALAKVNKAESWLKKYLPQFLIGLGCGVLLTHFIVDKIWK